MQNHLSTIAKRAALARRLEPVASAALGLPVTLTRSDLDRDELGWRIENVESARGPVHWVHLSICPRGVNLHTKFGFREFAPAGAGGSGKWNHYLWPRAGQDAASYADSVVEEVGLLLSQIRVIPGVVRADRPSMLDWWAQEREKFAAECAARA